MNDKTFHVEIVTPRGEAFSGDAVMVALPGVMAPFQVLVHHAPIMSQLGLGMIRIIDEHNKETRFATSGGFMEMNHNRMTVIVESIESALDIDVARAESAFARAQEHIRNLRNGHETSIDLARAQEALARATNRLKVAGKM
ncbi:MAG TPA: ATP synthase F1 subunit epsilon [Candidatus Kapabacteria bacterium]|nr:ATP synthase F1 subunit epsilon [Candidatus Kapabacteria bacterium]